MSSVDLVNQTSIEKFTGLSKKEQITFLNQVKIKELKEHKEPAVLKKFIAMKVLMEVRIAAEDKSPFNLTAQFRNLLAFITSETDVRLTVKPTTFENKSQTLKGYNLFHQSDTAIWNLSRKFYDVGMDDNNNFFTKKSGGNHRRHLQALKEEEEMGVVNTNPEEWQEWTKLNDSLQLRKLFDDIKKESTYENTLAYDLFCAAVFSSVVLLGAALKSEKMWPVLCVPLALAIDVAIYALTIPTALTFFIMEQMLINPIKWAVNALKNDKYEEFIEEVSSSPPLK